MDFLRRNLPQGLGHVRPFVLRVLDAMKPVTAEKLQAELAAKVTENPNLVLAIRSDTEAPVGQLVKVMDAAKAAKVKAVTAYTKQPGQK